MKLDNQPHVLRTLAKFIVWKKESNPYCALMIHGIWRSKAAFWIYDVKLKTPQSACIVPEIALKMSIFERYRPDTLLQKFDYELDLWCKHETKEHLSKATLFKRSKKGCEFEIRIHLGHLACVKNFEALYLQSDFRHVAYMWQISWYRYIWNKLIIFCKRKTLVLGNRFWVQIPYKISFYIHIQKSTRNKASILRKSEFFIVKNRFLPMQLQVVV